MAHIWRGILSGTLMRFEFRGLWRIFTIAHGGYNVVCYGLKISRSFSQKAT